MPLKIYISTQSGRNYLLACHKELGFEILYRLDIRRLLGLRRLKTGRITLRIARLLKYTSGVCHGAVRECSGEGGDEHPCGRGEEYILREWNVKSDAGALRR